MMAGFTVDAWTRLADAIGADAETRTEVELAATDPTAYFAAFEERSLERGIESPDQVDPAIALVDGLMDRNRLVEFDWKESDDSILAGLQELDQVAAAGVELSARDLAGLEEALPYASEVLAEYGLSIVDIGIGSDSYPTTVLDSDLVPTLRAAAEPVGVPIRVWGKAETVNHRVTLHFDTDDDDIEDLVAVVGEWDEVSRLITRLERSAPHARLVIDADPPVGGIRRLHLHVEGGKRDAFGSWDGSPTHVTIAELDDPRKVDQVHRTGSAVLRYQIIKRFVGGMPVDLEDWEPRWGDPTPWT
jgi:hypothetical protein